MDQEESSVSNSFWGFLETVKKSSAPLLDIVQEDFQEFTKTIKSDTSVVVKTQIEKIQTDESDLTSKISSGLSNMLGINEQEAKSSTKPNRVKSKIEALQNDKATFASAPEDEEVFNVFVEGFDLQGKIEEISQLLASNEIIRELHTNLVPQEVSYKDFWERYYFKLEKLQGEEARRADLMKRVSEDEEELKWDDDDDDDVIHNSGKVDDTPPTDVDEKNEKNEKTDSGSSDSGSSDSSTQQTSEPVKESVPKEESTVLEGANKREVEDNPEILQSEEKDAEKVNEAEKETVVEEAAEENGEERKELKREEQVAKEASVMEEKKEDNRKIEKTEEEKKQDLNESELDAWEEMGLEDGDDDLIAFEIKEKTEEKLSSAQVDVEEDDWEDWE